jgi:phosphoribosyl 1,2-cyclic phosphodiesterase
MQATAKLELRFWGVRGSIPTPHADNLGVGGNTACIELRFGNLAPVILDAGTGLRQLGLALEKEFPNGAPVDIFFSHFHWDHIQGLPFFAPLHAGAKLMFHSALPPGDLYQHLCRLMGPPFFPVDFRNLVAPEHCRQIGPGGLARDGFTIQPFPLHHPQGASGHRFETHGIKVIYASDHEHGDADHDQRLVREAEGADLLIYDSQFTSVEYEQRRGWGHSTSQEATRVARQARVKQLVLFHHDPQRSDDSVNDIVNEARQVFENTIAAREGMTFTL